MPDPTLPSGLCAYLAILFVFGIAGDGVLAEERNVTLAVSFGSDEPKIGFFDICQRGYIDMSWEKQLKFYKNEDAARTPRSDRIGNGRQLQCQNSSYCSSWAPNSATCTRRIATRIWDCNATIYNDHLELSNVHFECVRQDDLHKDCVYRDSCVMFHSLTSRRTDLGKTFGFIVLGVAIFIGIVGACIYIRRRKNYNRSSVTTTTVIQGGATTTRTYAPPPNPPTVTTTNYVNSSQLPYPPAYQPAYQGVAAMPATMQQAPPFSQQAAPGAQPAFNPAFNDHVQNPGPYEPPPAYSSTGTGYPTKY